MTAKEKKQGQMKLASHNSWSYLPVRKWWMRPLNFIAKCQDKQIFQQYHSGARMFDLRLRWDKKEKQFYVSHGIVTYESLLFIDLECLKFIADKEKQSVFVRVLLEDSGREDFTVDAEFAMLCYRLQREFSNLIFIGGWPARKRWRQKLFNFGTKEPSIDEQHVSVSGRWWQFVPYRWARGNNERVLEEGTNSEFLMLDFI